MARGKKLDIFIGANIDEGWQEIQTPKNSTAKSAKILESNKHQLYFSKEKRRGKTVTLVGEFFLSKEEIQTLLKSLKKKLGCGGSYKDGFMEFQGELKEKIRPLLQKEGFQFKPKH